MHRWNLTILLIVTAAVLGFMAGYIYRDRITNWYQKERLAEEQPDISGQILNASIQEILQPKTSEEAVTNPAEVYSFTGYVRGISTDGITVERPDDATAGADSIDFILTDTTVYKDTRTEADETGIITKLEDGITLEDLNSGDIVTIYSAEDIRTATDRHVTKVERISLAATPINE